MATLLSDHKGERLSKKQFSYAKHIIDLSSIYDLGPRYFSYFMYFNIVLGEL